MDIKSQYSFDLKRESGDGLLVTILTNGAFQSGLGG